MEFRAARSSKLEARTKNDLSVRQHYTLSALYAIARPIVSPSVTRVDQSKRLKLG